MKNILIICISVLLSSCASSYVSFQNIEKPKNAYKKIFVVSVFNDIQLNEINKMNYENYFRGNINNIDFMNSRRRMENALTNHVSNPRTLVTSSHDKFKVNEDVSYSEFLSSVHESGSEAILVINETAYYYEVSERINCNGDIRRTENPKAIFHIYLFDAINLQTVWIGKIHSSGTELDGSKSLYNSMSRKLNNKLVQENFLRKPLL